MAIRKIPAEYAQTDTSGFVGEVGKIFYELPTTPGTSPTLMYSDGVTIGGIPVTAESIASEVAYTPAGTGAVPTSVQSKLHESISVLDFGADPTGITDSSNAIYAAINFSNGAKRIYFPAGTYKFSVSITQYQLATEFYGEGTGTIIQPLGPSAPVFVINYNTGFPPFLQYRFHGLTFTDSGTHTACAIWTEYALDIVNCQFVNLKFGVITNCGEWCRMSRSYINSCYYGVFATASATANDPLNFTPGNYNSNPSEWYFDNCWFNVCNIAYYEDQPDNTYDQTTHVKFDSCQLIGNSTCSSAVITYGGAGQINFYKCWWEGYTGSSSITVNVPTTTSRNYTFPSNVIYSYGSSVIVTNCFGLVTTSPIYVKLASTSRLTQTPYTNPPTLMIDESSILNGSNFNIDSGVLAYARNVGVYGNGGLSAGAGLDIFTNAENIHPMLPSQGGVIYPAKTWPVTPISAQSAGLTNMWLHGTCSTSAMTAFGPVTQTITSGSGFIGNNYNAVTSVGNGFGVSSGSLTTITNHIYVMTFGIRQNTGSSVSFFLNAQGASNSPYQIGNFSVAGDNAWTFFIAITGCPMGGTGGLIALTNSSGSSIAFDLTAVQLVAFSTLERAVQFANSGVYIESNPL